MSAAPASAASAARVPPPMLRMLLDASEVPAVLLDRTGRITYANGACGRLCGTSRDRLVGSEGAAVLVAAPQRRAFTDAVRLAGSERPAVEVESSVTVDGRTSAVTWSLGAPEGTRTPSTVVIGVGVVPETNASVDDLRALLEARTAELDDARRLASIGFFQRDAITGGVTWSPEMYAIFAIDPSQPPPSAAEFDALCTPESLTLREAAVARATELGEPWEVELTIRRPSGESRVLLQRGVVERGAGGAVTGYHGTVLDVTEQRRIERDLRELWSSTTIALDATTDSVGLYRVVLDAENRFQDAVPIFVNRVGRRRWFGDRQPEELRTAGIFATLPALRPLIFDLYAQVAETGRAFHGPRAFDTAEGRRIIDLSIAPFAGGLVHVGRDVTDEHEALDRLQASEDTLRRMVEGIDAIVSYRAPGNGIPTLSPQVERLLGYRPEAVAPYLQWESLIHPDDFARCKAAWASPENAWDLEYRVRHADGHWIWVNDHGRRIGDGPSAGSFGVVTDVTRARQADERFRAIFEENPEAIGIVRAVRDGDGRFVNAEFVAANRAARDLFLGGADPAQSPGLCLFGLAPEIDSALFAGAADACQRNERFDGVVRRRVGERDRWVDIAFFPFDGGLAFVGRDTTAERAAASVMMESEARFRAVTNSAADGIVTIDVMGRIVAANPSAERMFGAGDGELAGRLVNQLMPDRYATRHAAAIHGFATGEDGQVAGGPMPLHGLRGDGTEFPIELSLSSWTLDGRRYATAFIRDTTERARAEEAARLAGERLRRFFDANLFGIQVAEPGGRVLEANDYWLNLTGWTREELARGEVDWRIVTGAESLDADDRAIAEIRAGGTCAPFEKEYVRRDGTRVPALVVRTTLPGEEEHIASFVLDTSALRDATRGLARLAAAIEQTSESVVITDTDARILYVNPAFERASGYAASEALGQSPRLFKSGVHSDSFYGVMWATLAAGETWHGELINRRKDGTNYTEVASISPIRDAAGRTTAYVAVKRDVTAERELEAVVRQGQRLDILGQLAGGVAHDFNNLLAAIRGYGEFVQAALPEGTSVRADMDEVMRAAGRATGLTRQLLVFSRRQAVAPQEVRPAEVIAEAAAMLRRLVGEHIELVTRLEPDTGTVLADPGALEQVVMNLAVNARDAMPAGGRLAISTEHRVATTASPARVRIVVSDTGCGMDSATLARIYEPFFTTKETGKGTGLGLATVYGIVQACGGQIHVESTPGDGTTFAIDLPAVVATGDGPRNAATVEGGVETILVAEDDPATRAVVRRMLERLGYRVVDVASGREALAAVREARVAPDLLLTDVRMPGIQGPDLARQLRASRPGLPVVFMSAFAEELTPDVTGLADFRLLDKPFVSDALAHTVRIALDGEAPA